MQLPLAMPFLHPVTLRLTVEEAELLRTALIVRLNQAQFEGPSSAVFEAEALLERLENVIDLIG